MKSLIITFLLSASLAFGQYFPPTASSGVSSVTGTANQIISSASTGAITLSLPQSIAATSGVSFAAVTVPGPNTSAPAVRAGSIETQSYAVNNAWIGENVYFNGSNFVYRADGNSNKIAFGSSAIQVEVNAFGAAGSTVTANIVLTFSPTAITAAVPINLKGYTVATLPTGVIGMTAYVTDALAPTFLATVVGGGAVKTPVFFNGSNWVGY